MSNTEQKAQKAHAWIDAKRESPIVAQMVWVAVPNVVTCRYQVLLCYMDSDEQWRDACGVLMFRRCLLYTSPSPRDLSTSRMPSSA